MSGRERSVFITGKLATPALTKLLKRTAAGFEYEIMTLPAQVAALMTTRWIARRIAKSLGGRIVIPGGCQGDISEIRSVTGSHVVRGPVDLNDLPSFLGGRPERVKYGPGRMKIIAEVVDAPLMTVPQIVRRAARYRRDGADWVDLGCMKDTPFPHLSEAIRELRRRGFSVSVDTFDADELRKASRAGARMYLSVYSKNLDVARELNGRVVVIPDPGKGNASLYANMRALEKAGVEYIADPILDPLCMGAARSVARYVQLRKKFPDTPALMGAGNLAELTEADNVGVHALLGGFCAELGIDYVLTTEVAGWNRGAVRQLAIARQIMEHAVDEGALPRKFDERLLALNDNVRRGFTGAQLKAMSRNVKDLNYRIFVTEGFIHVFNREVYVKTKTVEGVFGRLNVDDASHAFYLGKELQKAETALRLGKNYTQESPLDWGYLSYGKRR